MAAVLVNKNKKVDKINFYYAYHFNTLEDYKQYMYKIAKKSQSINDLGWNPEISEEGLTIGNIKKIMLSVGNQMLDDTHNLGDDCDGRDYEASFGYYRSNDGFYYCYTYPVILRKLF